MPPHERPPVAGRQPTVGRAVNKPPLTPKIATRAATPSQQAPTLATPLARRSTAESTLSVNNNHPRDRDELASPVSAFLGTNVTPRSGARQSRVNSVNSTPNGTPNPDRQDPLETRPGPVVTFSPASEAGGGTRQDRDSKFFYASDAPKLTPQTTRQAGLPRPFSPPLASPSMQDSLASKFVYANGKPELQPPAKIGPSVKKSPGSVVSTAPRRVPSVGRGNVPKALSPIKSPQQTAPTTGNSGIISPRSPVVAVSPQISNQLSQGRVSLDPPSRPKSHRYTKSATIIEPVITAKRASIQGPAPSLPSSRSTSPLLSPHPGPALPSNPAATGFASLLQAAEDFAEAEEDMPQSHDSPTKTPQESQPTELVANARRERKVQDLQITNASLEAINRTLERQLRKQTAELRRYQRLSRSGVLGMGSIGSRLPSESAVEGGGLAKADIDLDGLSEKEGENDAEDAKDAKDADLDEPDEPEEEDDMSGSEASGEMSPGATELRQEKRRRDERRLEVDLSRHQQLLVDSQKINQSLKRCLGWTEELIREGKRALEYQVRASDIGLGGRVLAPEEVERRARRERGEEEVEDQSVDEDAIYAIDALGGEFLVDDDTETTWSKDPQDRDSGIELRTDGGEEGGQRDRAANKLADCTHPRTMASFTTHGTSSWHRSLLVPEAVFLV
ncbi:hypothetical protein B0I37DRAFT_414826 [Chaetomium sp. MPI-CAGE-AT-0009]|nr:hypothetical protein B0I37DRAFT_414826 [Chaetomium sp. MPI-CAGE-AT-0009]